MDNLEYEGPMIIRTCKETIGLGINTRKGMFRIAKKTHSDLVNTHGKYLFAVHLNSGITKVKVMNAEEVKYSRNISWPVIFQ